MVHPLSLLLKDLKFILIQINMSEIFIQPTNSIAEVGDTLSIECNVTGVSELTTISFYRDEPWQPVCYVTSDYTTYGPPGINCVGEINATGDRLFSISEMLPRRYLRVFM